MAIGNNFSERPNNIGLYAKVHGQVRFVPVPKNTDSNKVFTLSVHLLHRIVTTLLSEYRVVNFDTSLTNFLFNIVLNRQTMTVPTWNIRSIKTAHSTRLHDNIFQYFVNRMAKVDVPIGVRRPIMQNILFTATACFPYLSINIFFVPLFKNARLSLCQIRTHWETRFWKI